MQIYTSFENMCPYQNTETSNYRNQLLFFRSSFFFFYFILYCSINILCLQFMNIHDYRAW